MSYILTTIYSRIVAFSRSGGGNVTLIFALALIPLVGMTGAAIDYSRAASARMAMQSALDATALAISKEASSLDATSLNEKAASYFTAAFHRSEPRNVTVTAVYSAEGGNSVTLTAQGSVPTTLMGVLNINQIPIASSTKTAWGTGKLRVALVLDNTGSMADDGKMSALKNAAHDLLDIFKNATETPGEIQVAIVPFNTFVRVNPATYKDKPWIDWSLSGSVGGGGHDSDHSGSGCNGGDGGDNSGPGSGSDDDNPCAPSKDNWNGCFTDRNAPYDVQNTTPISANTDTYFPAVNCSLTTITSLSSDWNALGNAIDAMVPAGNTNQPIGLAWGWQSLTSGDPLNAPALPPNTKQAVILLTDGMNTENRETTNQATINAREQLVCTNMKTAGITVYTVLVMAGNSTVLQNCASPDNANPPGPKYFALTAANQISDAFNVIGTSLSQLRIAR